MKLFKKVIKDNLKLIIFYLLIGVIINFLDLYNVTFYQKILDNYQYGTLKIGLIIIYGILLLAYILLSYLDNYPTQKLTNKLYWDFKLQSLVKLKTIDYLEYQKIGTGRLSQKIEDGSTASRDLLINFYFKIFRWLFPTILFSIIFIFRVRKELILYILFGYIIVILVSNIILKKLYNLKENILTNQESVNKHLIRGFMELVVFRTNKKYDTEIKITENGIENIVNTKTRIKLVHEIFFTLFEIIVCILNLLILIYALKTNLSVGAIVTVMSLLSKAYQPIAIFNVEYIDYKLNRVTVKKYIDLLELKDDVLLNSGNRVTKLDGNIEFKNVSFNYNNNQNTINNLSFKIKANTSVALVGESGSGKSTILKLLMGLLKYNSGSILIDKYELSKINLNDYYGLITYISQESPILDGTSRENLVFGLNTELGEKGIRLSGGERQRIALARIFFDKSKIIILDEATSALDNITECFVMNNIINKLKNKTLIIVAHRLETIKKVNNIYVLSDGVIKENGTYDELINKKSCFYELYKAIK